MIHLLPKSNQTDSIVLSIDENEMQFTNTKIFDKIFKIIVQYKHLYVVNKYECISFNEQS